MFKTQFELEILEHFGTYRNCEKHMRWAPGTVTKIVQGKRQLKLSEIYALQEIFEICSFERFKLVFFALYITKRYNSDENKEEKK